MKRAVGRRVAAVAVLLVAVVAVTPAERAEAQSVPNIWWGITGDLAAEPSEVTTLYFQVNQNLAAALTVSYTLGGTATCGTDYTIAGADCAQMTGTFTMPAGTARFSANPIFPVTILGDAVSDTGETIILSINDGTGYNLGSGTTATVTIVESSGQAAFRIGGQPSVNGTLTGHRVCDDPEGNGAVSYEWQKRATPARFGFAAIPGATSQSYTLQQADSGHYLRLRVQYTDGNGVTLNAYTPIVGPIGPVAAGNTVGFSRGDYNVREGDPLRPTLTFGSPTAAEQTFEIVFQTCDADPRNDISVDHAAAIPFVGSYNVSATHSVTVPAGVTSHTFSLPVPLDGEIEDYETFVMGFGAIPTGITIGSQQDATNQGQYAVVQIVNVSVVPDNWALKPSGVGPGEQFRLLFKTHNERNATASTISTYDTFVRNRVGGASTGHADIRQYSSTFRVVGSTPTVDAASHTATGIMVGGEPSHTPWSTPIYWLNGPKIADDHNDFWDGTWDDNSPSAHRRANGNASTNNRGPNTGTRTGTTHATAGTKKPSRALGNSSNQTRWGGGTANQNPIDQGDIPQSMNNVYIGLSGIFEVGTPSLLGWKRPPETASVRFGGHDRVVNVVLPVPPGVHGNGVLFTISDGTARDNLKGSCGPENDYDNHDNHGYVEHWHYRDLRAGGSVSIPIRLCSPSVGKNFKIHWGDASPNNVEYPETSYDPAAPNCKAAEQVIPARPHRAPRVEGHNRHGVPIVDPGEPGRPRQVNTVSWTCFTTVTVLASSGGDDSLDSVSAQDDVVPCDAAVAIDRARAAFEWHLSHGSNAALFWRILNTLGADDLPAKPSGVTDETISAQDVEAFSSGKGWAGWAPINDAMQRCTAADDPDPVTPDPDPVTPDPEVSVAAGAGVTEGGDAVFTVAAVPAPSAALDVTVAITQTGDFGVSPGSRTVTIPVSGSAVLTVATANDSADEADGSVTATVGAGSGYTVSATSGSASVAVSDDDDPPPVCVPSLPSDAVTAAEVTGWRNQYSHAEHQQRWDRVLAALGVDTGETAMTVADAQTIKSRFDNSRWDRTVRTLEALEQCDDPPPPPAVTPEVSITAGSGITEGGDATFTVTADPAPTAALTVDVTVSQSGDFGVATGSQSVTVPMSGSVTLTVATTGDSADEPNGSVTVTVDVGSGYTVSQSAGTATVAVADDDDPAPPPPADPEISITAGSGITEGGDATFTVTADPAPAAPLTVDVTVSQSGDFGVSPGTRTVTIPTTGSTTLTIATTNDTTDETDGTVTATVSAGQGYTVSATSGSASVAVADDDDPPPTPVNATPSFSISDASGAEGGTLTFTVTLSPSSNRYAWVHYYARPAFGTAASATFADFAQTYGILTFKPGDTTKTITVALVDDNTPEANETFKLVLYTPAQAKIADNEATGTITDND
ncbi:Calx-beta domain-containing protein [Candidatus Poriferisocius sp.]|uniref:Calx-beta domain-containing protein n=1 Tax=Candidatus Poriferisocius sp. TaxID=3101276 RepID=UPI003B5B9224